MRTFCTTHSMGKTLAWVTTLALGSVLTGGVSWADDDEPRGKKRPAARQQPVTGEQVPADDAVAKPRPDGRPGAAARNRLRQGQGLGGQLGQDGLQRDAMLGEGGGGERPMRDMTQVVSMMIRQFDQDGDEKLDNAELTEMLKAIRQRPGMAGFLQGGNRPQQRPGAGKGQRPGQGNISDEAGGVTPKRPPVSDDPVSDDPVGGGDKPTR